MPAACELFGKSREAVHKAIRLGRVYSLADVWFGDRSLGLIVLGSAQAYWGRDDGFDKGLDEWRSEAKLIYVRGETWTILHPTTLVYLTYPTGGLE